MDDASAGSEDSESRFKHYVAGTQRTFMTAVGTDLAVGPDLTVPSSALHLRRGTSGTVPSLATYQEEGMLVQANASAADSAAVTILASNTGQSRVDFADDDSSTRGSVIYDHSTDKLRTNVGGTADVLVLNSSGHMGLNELSPSTLLHIKDASNPEFRIEETGAGVNAGILASHTFYGQNSLSAAVEFAEFQARTPIITSGSERGSMRLNLAGKADAVIWDADANTATYNLEPAGQIEGAEYAPTLTNFVNIDNSTERVHYYQRTGNIVTVHGYTTVNATSSSSTTALRISVPITPDNTFGANEVTGTATFNDGTTTYGAGFVTEATGTNLVGITFTSTTTGNHEVKYTFTYRKDN
jgi:hypothetical protein